VVSCAAEPLAAMSFTGVFRRLKLSYDVEEPGLPRNLIAKFSTPDPEGIMPLEATQPELRPNGRCSWRS
jgi:hypothetical protein